MVMGELTTKTDVAVIGGGPGGYTGAIRAAQLGLDVILIERGLLGGCCTNVGCIPSKALIHAAGLLHDARSQEAARMGIEADIKFDFGKAQEWKDSVVKELRDGIATLCRLNGVEIISGRAYFASAEKIAVQTESGIRDIEFNHAILATGTRAKAVPGLEIDHSSIIDSDDIFSLTSLPKSLVIVGGGYIAAEMASMFAKFGSKVTIVYRGKRLLRGMEPEQSEAVQKGLMKLGVEILFESVIRSTDGRQAVVSHHNGEGEIAFDKLLVAAGRKPDFEGLALEKAGIEIGADGLIGTDAMMRTSNERVYAVGDIAAGPQLAHKAFRQGKIAAEAIAGQASAYDNTAMPMVVFSEPELASVGLCEEEARAQGHKVIIGKMPFSASGRAKSMAKTEGFVKVIADESGTILGAHIAGEGAGTLIAELALAIEMGAQLEDIAATIHAHPTLPETVMESAEDALKKAIHHYRKG